MPDTLTITSTPITLTSSSRTALLGRNTARSYLAIQNTGLGAVSIGFTPGSSSGAGGGISLDPAATAGGQGGSWEFTTVVPSNPIYGYSAAGTTVVVLEG